MPNFLDHFRSLLLENPRYNLKIVNSENCDYADTVLNSKNCYYSFGIFHGEDVYYSRYSRDCRSCSDLTFSFNCQWCYQCLGCSRCYDCDFCKFCSGCNNCRFCENCLGCKNCFGCIGLKQKEYYFFNQDLSKEEYFKKTSEIDLNEPKNFQLINDYLENLKITFPQLAIHQTMCEDVVGDNIVEAKNSYQCFDSYDLEDCNYCIETNSLKNCCDITICFKAEECYQCVHSPGCYNCNFCYHCDYSSDSEFCAFSKNLKNCFGCVYLKDKEYYILNEPYSKDQYLEKIKIIKKELVERDIYNLVPYFISDYEKQRFINESDPVINNSIPA